jgi:FtsP/CotA-like multicopper oxidase with cupredoxin domain
MKRQFRQHPGWRVVLAAPVVVSLAVPAIILAQSPDAQLAERNNQVDYSPAGSSQWQPAPAEVALAPGDRLRTGAGSSTRVTFGDGTTTALAASTGIRLDRLDADPTLIGLTQVAGITQTQVAVGAPGSGFALATPSLAVQAAGGACPWVRVAADGTTLVRHYGTSRGPAVEPQPVQEVVFSPVPVPGPGGPVPVPMPQVVTVWKAMPPSMAPDEQPLMACGSASMASGRDATLVTAAARASDGQTATGVASAAAPPSLRVGDTSRSPLLGTVLAGAPVAGPAEQTTPGVSVSNSAGTTVQLAAGFETEVRPGQAPTPPAPIGTAAAQAAARTASALAMQQANAAAQQAGAVAAQSQAAAALAGATAAVGQAFEAARLTSLVQQLTQGTPAPAPTAAALPPVTIAQGSCVTTVGGLCNIAGAGFFGQCTKIGSMSCIVTVSIAGAGQAGKTPVSPVVQLTTTQGAEQITCTPPVAGAPTFTCIGITRGDVGQASTVSVKFAPGITLAGIITPGGGSDLAEPAVRASVGGVLDTTLAARYGPVVIAGRTVQAEAYENSYPSPTLRFRPGERLRVKLENQLPAQSFDTAAAPAITGGRHPAHDAAMIAGVNFSNLHIHGMHVSPVGNGDNIFLTINPGQSFQYDYPIPTDQPPGMYWYHPHRHGLTDQQDGFGMMGAMIVEGALDRLPGIFGLRERLLVIHATQLTPQGTVVPGDQQDPTQYIRTVNGQLNPVIRIQPGETQRWRIGNTSADSFLNVSLDGNQLYQIASDGNTWAQPVAQNSIVLPPAGRAEVLVKCAVAGTTTFRTLPYVQGFINTPNVPLATVICEGPAWTPQPLPSTLLPVLDLRNIPLTGNNGQPRQVVFSELGSPPCPPNGFCPVINGVPFDPDRVDIQVKLGTTEEWIVSNTSIEEHPFHIHVNPFQVTAINGNPVPLTGYLDTQSIPIGGSFTMRTQFKDFVGKFVIHCHILGHEDAGMMAVVEVIP